MGKRIDGIISAGLAMVLAGSIGAAAMRGEADDAYSPAVAKAILLENVLEARGAGEMPEWRRQRHAVMEKELEGLKTHAYLMQDKEAYESAREAEAWLLFTMGIGYTLCIAGRLKEKTEQNKI